jgi:hypothetical protein
MTVVSPATISTRTPGTTAPDWSATTPRTDPVGRGDWASSRTAHTHAVIGVDCPNWQMNIQRQGTPAAPWEAGGLSVEGGQAGVESSVQPLQHSLWQSCGHVVRSPASAYSRARASVVNPAYSTRICASDRLTTMKARSGCCLTIARDRPCTRVQERCRCSGIAPLDRSM